jgi:hypothetical protein
MKEADLGMLVLVCCRFGPEEETLRPIIFALSAVSTSLRGFAATTGGGADIALLLLLFQDESMDIVCCVVVVAL